jgi:hypothetical protein
MMHDTPGSCVAGRQGDGHELPSPKHCRDIRGARLLPRRGLGSHCSAQFCQSETTAVCVGRTVHNGPFRKDMHAKHCARRNNCHAHNSGRQPGSTESHPPVKGADRLRRSRLSARSEPSHAIHGRGPCGTVQVWKPDFASGTMTIGRPGKRGRFSVRAVRELSGLTASRSTTSIVRPEQVSPSRTRCLRMTSQGVALRRPQT